MNRKDRRKDKRGVNNSIKECRINPSSFQILRIRQKEGIKYFIRREGRIRGMDGCKGRLKRERGGR